MSLAAGTRLGPYEILSPLGAGGMGEVYRARDSQLGRDVAIKFVSETLAKDAENRSGTSDIFHSAPGLPVVGGDIWIMPSLGGTARRIVEHGESPSWTPDSSALLYVHGTFRTARIARIPESGGEGKDIPIDEPFVAQYYSPHLSDDGRWLLYQNGRQIQVVPAAGGKPKILAIGQSPAWGAGSKTVLFTNATPGRGRSIWRAPFSLERGEFSSNAQPLTFGSGTDVGAAASRDGTSVAFSAVDESLNLEEIPFDAEAGRVTGSPRELTPGNNLVGFFDPSPDGRAVVFEAERGEASEMFRVDPPAAPVQLTRVPGLADTNPVWSPDGKVIAFTRAAFGIPEAKASLWTMNADGTNPKRVTDYSGEMVWLSDRKAIIGRGDNLLRLDLVSGATEPLEAPKIGETLVTADPTGEWLLCQFARTGSVRIFALPISGGSPRDVDTGSLETYHPFFSPSGRWIYFQPAHKNLYRVPGPAQNWAKAEPQQATDFSGIDLYIENPKISRDGTKLFYTRGRRTGDIVILRFGSAGDKKTK